VNGVRLPTADDDNDSDEDSEADGAPRDNETARAAAANEDAATSSTSLLSSPARSRLHHSGGGISATSDFNRDSDAPDLSSDASRPPSSSPDRDEVAIDAIKLGALLDAEAASHTSTHNATSTATGHAWKGTSNVDAIAMDEDEDLWDALGLDTGAVASAPATATATTTAPPVVDDDQEMWDIIHELEQEKAKETAHRPNPVQVQPETDDLDDLYL